MPDLLPRLPHIEGLLGRRLAQIDAGTLEQMVPEHGVTYICATRPLTGPRTRLY